MIFLYFCIKKLANFFFAQLGSVLLNRKLLILLFAQLASLLNYKAAQLANFACTIIKKRPDRKPVRTGKKRVGPTRDR